MGTSTKELALKLKEIAMSQGGFFTAAQAVSTGYADSVHGYHLRNGSWERAGRGIYRLKDGEKDKWSEFHLLLLWSRGKDGIPQGVYCRETALWLHGCNEESPKEIHMVVPNGFRRNTEIPRELRLYQDSLSDEDRQVIRGLPVTTMAKTVTDIGSVYIKPKILARVSEERVERLSFGGKASASVRAGEWAPGVTFLDALQRGED